MPQQLELGSRFLPGQTYLPVQNRKIPLLHEPLTFSKFDQTSVISLKFKVPKFLGLYACPPKKVEIPRNLFGSHTVRCSKLAYFYENIFTVVPLTTWLTS